MAYARLDKSGCVVRKGNCQVRLNFYLDETDPRHSDKHLYLVDVTSSEYLAGYPGEVYSEGTLYPPKGALDVKGKLYERRDIGGQPVDQTAYDLWLESLPHVWQNTPFHTHFIYLPATFAQDDIKAAIELHLPNFYKAFQERRDEVQGGMRHGWAIETRIKPTNFFKTETKAEYGTRVAECQTAIDALNPFIYKPKEGGKGKTYPATEIDVGSTAEDRDSILVSNHTWIDYNNAANATGIIDTIEIWCTFSLTNADVGTAEETAADSFTCRDKEDIGAVTSGSKQTFSGLDLDIETGWWVGLWFDGGQIERSTSGHAKVYQDANQNNFTNLGTQYGYAPYSGDAISLYGTGETSGAEYDVSCASNINLSDSNSTTLTIHPIATSDLVLIDSDSVLFSLYLSLADNLVLTDSDIVFLKHYLSLTNDLALSDSGLIILKRYLSLTDDLVLADLPSPACIFGLALSDNLILADSNGVGLAFYQTLVDNLALADSSLIQRVLSLILTDNLSLADQLSSMLTLNPILTESLVLTDQAIATRIMQLLLSNNLTLADLAKYTDIYELSVSDNLVLSDSAALFFILLRKRLLYAIRNLPSDRELSA